MKSDAQRPALAAFTEHFGTRPRISPPNPLSVWVAELHDTLGDFSFRVSVTGDSETDVLDRLDSFLADIVAAGGDRRLRAAVSELRDDLVLDGCASPECGRDQPSCTEHRLADQLTAVLDGAR